MKMLLLLRGLPASGKSKWVYDNHLQDYTVSSDSIRLLLGSNELTVYGNYTTNQSIHNSVWKLVYDVLEERFKLGAFTVFDATNIKGADMTKTYKLARQYRYRVYCVDFTDVPKEECIKRDRLRDESKRVGKDVIERMYQSMINNKVPSGIKVIKPDEWLQETRYRTEDVSQYRKVVHIGDIHGCYTALRNYLDKPLEDDVLYVFIGDFIDRGLENVEVTKYIASIAEKSNVVLLEGNHEKNYRCYLEDEVSNSKDFESFTRSEFDVECAKNASFKENMKTILRKIRQCYIYKWNDKVVFCNHGGISKLPANLSLINTKQLINGVGQYRDMLTVDKAFAEQNWDKEVYQVHGHRNVEQVPIQVNNRCFNICEHIEYGGNLRVLELDENGFNGILVPNPVFRKKDTDTFETVPEMLDVLDTNDYIKIVPQLGTNISSYNFSRAAFQKGIWDDITTKARGLFINTSTYEIVARGYNKFFNINERPETNADVLPNTLAYPVKVYKKENGFLGLLGYDKESDSLLFCSKSQMDGPYSNYFKTILLSQVSEEVLYNYMKPHNVTLVFEVIDIENDPHIIKYNKSKVVLLDIIENSVEFKAYPYQDVIDTANLFNIEYKTFCNIINNKEELKSFFKEISQDDYKWNNRFIEGFVFVDSNNFMFKYKCEYYKYWKFMRGQVEKMSKGAKPKVDNPFLKWVSKDLDRTKKDIITLRDEFLKENKGE